MLIEWDESLSVGNDKIDHDHQALIGITNELSQAVEDGQGKAIIADVLSRLSDYVGYHFDHEEQIMRRFRYSEMACHIQEHADLIKGLDELVYEHEVAPNVVTTDTLEFLKHWLVDHIKTWDHRLGLFLRRG